KPPVERIAKEGPLETWPIGWMEAETMKIKLTIEKMPSIIFIGVVEWSIIQKNSVSLIIKLTKLKIQYITKIL
ncbi:MAG: hypothetical protein QHG99_08620, partial [Methanomicrobiales archaeon]|nr:hypothetical protein [Methanomicrobiales archaeon]